MKRTLIALILDAASAIAFLFSLVVVEPVKSLASGVVTLARYIFAGPVPMALEAEATSLASRPLIVAKSFKARLFKRERPVVRPDWRMCPST